MRKKRKKKKNPTKTELLVTKERFHLYNCGVFFWPTPLKISVLGRVPFHIGFIAILCPDFETALSLYLSPCSSFFLCVCDSESTWRYRHY